MEEHEIQNMTREYMQKLGLTPEEIASWRIMFRKKRNNIATCRPISKKIIYNSSLLHLGRTFWVCVVAHEVAHIRAPKHNQNFQRVLQKLEPLAAGLADGKTMQIDCFLPEAVSLVGNMFDEVR